MRCVIADDSSIPRLYAKRILLGAGHEVVAECANGREAVDACASLSPDVAVLDISMPLMNGNDAAKVILAAGSAKHVVIASSQTQDGILAELRALGCLFVGKPYVQEQLLGVIAGLSDGP